MKPITSRIKRSPLFSYGESPMKQTDPKATTGGSIKGDDKEIVEKKEVRTQASKDFEAKCYNADKSRKRGVPGCTWADEEGTEAPSETEIVETKKTVEGDDLDYEADLYKKKEDKKVQGPANTRKQERASTFINRKVNKYRRQMGKYGTFDMEGNFTPNKDLSQRDIRKMLQAKGNLEGAQAGRKNVQSGIESGVGLQGTYYGGQRKMDKGELTKPEQKEIAKREAKRNAKRQAEGAIEVGAVNPFASFGNINTGLNLYTPTTNYMDLLKTPANMSSKGYSQKPKSPAAKSLKGNQHKLPQHLQDAIKAAPGKMKAPLKKGYFK